MCSREELEAVVEEYSLETMTGRLARETLRVRKILGSYMEAEHEIRSAFAKYREGLDNLPDFENYADVKRHLIDPALAHLWPAADESLILSIILHACMKNEKENKVPYTTQSLQRILDKMELEALRDRMKKLEERGLA